MSGATAIASVGRAIRNVIVGLSQELAEFHPTGGRNRRCAITALATTLATIVALAVHVDAVWWAAISAFVSVQASAPASLQRGASRIMGTVAGAAVALLLSLWIVDDHVALSLVLLMVSTTGVLGLQMSPHGYAWLLGAVTADLVLFSAWADPLSVLDIASSRMVEVIVGTLAAILVAAVLAPNAEATPLPPPVPGWSDPLGAQWPAAQHALRTGIGVMMVPLVWSWLQLPNLSQAAVTVAAVMAVPTLSNDALEDRRKITERALHRILGCLLGGIAGLACLSLAVENFLTWLLMLTVGVWIAAHVQSSQRGIGYVGTQGAVVFISTLVQGWGPPISILPGIDRFTGILGGLLILLVVSLLLGPSRPLHQQNRSPAKARRRK